MQRFLITLFVAAITTLVMVGCSGSDQGNSLTQTADVTIKMSVQTDTRAALAADIKKITLEISGDYMNSISDTFDYAVGQNIQKTYKVPLGDRRTFKMSGRNAANITIYAGQVTKAIVTGANSVTIDLNPVEAPPVLGEANFILTIPNVPDATRKIYGICFSPYMDGQDPNKGTQISEDQIRSRLQIFRFYMPPGGIIRYYGSTDGLQNIGKIAKEMGFYVIAGAWIGKKNEHALNLIQVQNAINTANAGYADMICIGAENLHRRQTDPNEVDEGEVDATPGDGTLIGYIKMAQNAVTVPVAYDEIFNVLAQHPKTMTVLTQKHGVALINIYEYWSGTNISEAIAATKADYNDFKAKFPGIKIMIGETGWPTGGDTVGMAVPNPENAKTFVSGMLDWQKEGEPEACIFSGTDEKWKVAFEGPQGAHWGIFDSAGVLKPCFAEILGGN